MPHLKITTVSGDVAEIRPMTNEDVLPPYQGDAFDARWHVCRWVGEGETVAPQYDCPAWIDHGRVFLPCDGHNRCIDFYPEGPLAGIGRTWYEAETGEPAIWRTSAPLWPASRRTGPLSPIRR